MYVFRAGVVVDGAHIWRQTQSMDAPRAGCAGLKSRTYRVVGPELICAGAIDWQAARGI